ncbi:MAG: PKD domain-containing protein [Verrucomicrobia bacterium]|nr:PKD domain-containing protein [Verrucomicrobiota bacterium]
MSNGPGATWSNAFHTIQAAVDNSSDHDVILATNGVYDIGGAMTPGYSCENRVLITNNLYVRSVNGPEVTIIEGAESPGGGCGPGAVRGVYMNAGVLDGFTITNGHTISSGDRYYDTAGGGVAAPEGNGIVTNCVITGNSAIIGGGMFKGTAVDCTISYNKVEYDGGGINEGILRNCFIINNKARDGGGVFQGEAYNCFIADNYARYNGGGAWGGLLNNCTVINNITGWYGGGAYKSAITNSIVWYNSASDNGDNWCDTASNIAFTCTTPLPPGTGNIENDPLLISSTHISPFSPCAGSGSTNSVSGLDIDGQPWKSPPSMGCDEVYTEHLTGDIQVSIIPEAQKVVCNKDMECKAGIQGSVSSNLWSFGDGTSAVNKYKVSHSWTEPGTYEVTLAAYNDDNPNGVLASAMIEVVDINYYVNSKNTNNAEYPFTSQETAAITIQDAVDAAQANGVLGAHVIVTNGVYNTGGALTPGHTCSNRVVITNNIILRSVNGPAHTIIKGAESPEGGCGPGAVRGVYMNGGLLDGFTIQNGYTEATGGQLHDTAGGGVNISGRVIVTNCVIKDNYAIVGGGILRGLGFNCKVINNSAVFSGGGTWGGSLYNCIISNNYVEHNGGGSWNTILHNCKLIDNNAHENGGGIYGGIATNTILQNNTAKQDGGGASESEINNCYIIDNTTGQNGGGVHNSIVKNSGINGNIADSNGGGTFGCTNFNCTIINNTAHNRGGGVSKSSVYNCIVWDNSADNDYSNLDYPTTAAYTCSTTRHSGEGNIDNDPIILSSIRISPFSPCVAAGSTNYIFGNDIDGQSWNYPPSMGCDEVYEDQLSGPIQVNIVPEFNKIGLNTRCTFTADIQGMTSSIRWFFDDGTSVDNRLHATHSWAEPGRYNVVLAAYNNDYPNGIRASCTIEVVEINYYVDCTNTNNAAYPYKSWETAATTIQDAVNAAKNSSIPTPSVVVTNGVYNIGSTSIPGYMCGNRVIITDRIILRSVNGPAVTIIQGAESSEGGCGPGAVRGVYISSGVLNGFTISNGYTLSSGNGDDIVGGGILAATSDTVITNCVISGNTAVDGGGVYGGIINNCIISNNTAMERGGGIHNSVANECVITSNNASNGGGVSFSTINNCTVSDNAAYGTIRRVGYNGGGIYMSTAYNCVVYNNIAKNEGGGAQSGWLYNCAIYNNHAEKYGGGASSCLLQNCTISGNTAFHGGGIYECPSHNCIIWNNSATDSYDNWHNTGYNRILYTCTSPLPSGEGNIDNDPQLLSSSHIAPYSPCVNSGSINHIDGADIDGQPWKTPPSMGCDEVYSRRCTGPLKVNIIPEARKIGYDTICKFTADIQGMVSSTCWFFDDGTKIMNKHKVSHSWPEPGIFKVELIAYNDEHPNGVRSSCLIKVVKSDHYVDAANTNSAELPYKSWETAAVTIQDAVNAAQAGGIFGAHVIVTNGVYDMGGAKMPGFTCSNRVVITGNINMRSVNGPDVTIIKGAESPEVFCGPDAVRGVYMSAGVLEGFTIKNGFTESAGYLNFDCAGGGVFTLYDNAIVTNCVITDNFAIYGGGTCGGIFYDCIISDNYAMQNGGGVYSSIARNCSITSNHTGINGNGGGVYQSSLIKSDISGNSADAYGGGAYSCTLNDCTIRNNLATYEGGGIFRSTANRCTIMGNKAEKGGGAFESVLDNCLISKNTAVGSAWNRTYGGGGIFKCTAINCTIVRNLGKRGGGVYEGTVKNSIISGNSAEDQGNNWFTQGDDAISINYSCTIPLPPLGYGNISALPMFASPSAFDYSLRSGSPCIDAGENTSMSSNTDRYGTPRPLDGDRDGSSIVDIGCFEFINPQADSDNDSLPDGEEIDMLKTNPISEDSDNDAIPDEWEYRYGLNPTSADDTAANPDGDPHSNIDEFIADTDPMDVNSFFHITGISYNRRHSGENRAAPIVTTLMFDSSSNRVYTLYGTTNLSTGTWTMVPGQIHIHGTSTTQSLEVTNTYPDMYYRLEVNLP